MLSRAGVLTIALLLCAANPARAFPIPEFDTGLDSVAAAAPTSATWTRLGPATSEVFPARLGTFAVHDPPGDRMVLFGGFSTTMLDDTWSLALGGASPVWSRLPTTGPRPMARVWHGEVYDPVRRRMLVIGGLEPSGGYLIDVWQLDLAAATPAWTQVTTLGTAPAARECRGALYDPVRDRVLLFGGFGYPNHFNDVWALNLAGTPTWHQLTPAGTPPAPRRAMTLTYDPVGDRLVVIGGFDEFVFMNDAWALGLSGTPAWQKLLPSGAVPPARFGHTATYDPARREIVVFGGYNGAFLNDMHVLSLAGAPAWSTVGSQPRPSLRDFHTVAYDPSRTRMVLIGGNNTGGALGDLWALNPATRSWTDITPPLPPAWPRARLGTFAVHDAAGDRVTLFGGYDNAFLDDTWSLAPGGAAPVWTRLAASGPHPSPRVWHAEVYDPVRRRMLVIGGLEPSGGYLIDVWQLNLASPSPTWSPLAVQGTPPVPRECRGALYDPVRDRVLVFGGFSYPNHLNDVWALDLSGTPTWNQLSPRGPEPAPRRAMSMTYDPERDRVLIFGGYDQVEYMNDLWELDLSPHPRWHRLNSHGTIPPPRYGHSATYDPVRGQMFVYGGYNGLYLGDAYVLPLHPPLNWSPVVSEGSDPGLRDFHTVVFDPARDRFLLYGGNDGAALGDLWAVSFGAAAGARSAGQGAGGLARPAAAGQIAGAAAGAHALALEGFVPNPARAAIQVAFTLPAASPARLELYDLAGRLVRSRSFDAPRPGRHTADLGRAQELRPGVYVLRLTQARRTVSARGVIVR